MWWLYATIAKSRAKPCSWPSICLSVSEDNLHFNDVTHEITQLISHYSDVIMGTMTLQITSVSIGYSTVCLGADQRKHQSFASLAFVRGIHRSPVNSPHKGPVMRKMFLFDDLIMHNIYLFQRMTATVVRWRVAPCSWRSINSVWTSIPSIPQVSLILSSGLLLGLCPANERHRYKVTPSLIGWAQT